MSELKSMKIEPSDAEKLYGPQTVMSEQPKYPYGLVITLDNTAVEKLGIDLPKVGEKMMIEAKVEVLRVSAEDTKDGMKKDVQLQITDLCIEAAGPENGSEVKQEQVKQEIRPDAFYAASPEYRG